MSCPYFDPVERLDKRSWPNPPRLPLGDPYSGVCRAEAERPWNPDPDALREWCSFGYARARCPRFPDSGGPDAVRFSVAGEAGGRIRLYYVLEKDHGPMEHGPMEYESETGHFTQGHSSELVCRQAQAYVSSFLRRKQQSGDE